MNSTRDYQHTVIGIDAPVTDPNRGSSYHWVTYMIAAILVTVISTILMVVIRLFIKLRVHREFLLEDTLLVVAEVFFVVWWLLLIVSLPYGRYVWNLQPDEVEHILYMTNIIVIMYFPTIFLAKWAVALQIQRVFTTSNRSAFWWCLQVFIWTNALFDGSMFITTICQCVPRQKIWDHSVPGRCVDEPAVVLGSGAFNLVVNWIITLLPLAVLKKLQMDRRKKITIAAIFAWNAVAAIASACRTGYAAVYARDAARLDTADNILATLRIALWAGVEIGCTIFATAFPTIPVFVAHVKARRRTARLGSQDPQEDVTAVVAEVEEAPNQARGAQKRTDTSLALSTLHTSDFDFS